MAAAATAKAVRTDPAPAVPEPGVASAEFRPRLLAGLAASIRERGYRDTTIAEIVRHARTSRRTFYEHFVTKDECFVALLETVNEQMRQQIAAAVDPQAPWQAQVRAAIEAYIDAVASEPELSVSWIRELPALGLTQRQVQRAAMDSLVEMVRTLSDTVELRSVGVGPVSRETAIVLLGGLRELTATVVEDGGNVRAVAPAAIDAAIALLGPGREAGAPRRRRRR